MVILVKTDRRTLERSNGLVMAILNAINGNMDWFEGLYITM
jgi:hypothetical protein